MIRCLPGVAAMAVAHVMPAAASPVVAQAIARFDAAIASEEAAFRSLPQGGDLRANLKVRIALEQAMRRALDAVIDPLSQAERQAASMAIWQRIGTVDAANTAYVRSILPPDGWFRRKRDGADVAHDAWLIVQHSPDQAFQRAVLARMRPMVATGDARGADYALLYDRTEMFAGRPQLYGSQVTCRDGKWQPAPVADPAGLARRRVEMDLPPMAEYLEAFEGGC